MVLKSLDQIHQQDQYSFYVKPHESHAYKKGRIRRIGRLKKTAVESWTNIYKILSIQIQLRLVFVSLNRMIFDIFMTGFVTEYYVKYHIY